MQLTGAEIILECLIREGVEVMFGYPGGAILPTYDAMSKYKGKIHHVPRSPRTRRKPYGGWICTRFGE
jgi:thiamine pyrophosphate-dependent acetolactate synthase large subunit-like protein